MSNYIYTNGQIYNTDELKHWKYVKKETVNGKTRYYYDDEEYDTAKRNYNRINTLYGEVDKLKKEGVEASEELRREQEADGKITIMEQYVRSVADDMLSKVITKHAEVGEQYVKAKREYRNVQINTLPRRIVAKGVAAVANLFQKIKKK